MLLSITRTIKQHEGLNWMGDIVRGTRCFNCEGFQGRRRESVSQAKKMRFLTRGREQMWVLLGCEEEHGKMICGARENSALKHVKLELSLF